MSTQTSISIERFLIPTTNPMMLGGTNTYIIGSANCDNVTIIDPGTDDELVLDKMIEGKRLKLILLTHHHWDHSTGAKYLNRISGAPVRAWRENLCIGAAPLEDGEVLDASGLQLRVLHTPGHTSDSVCYYAPAEGQNGVVFTGDTLLGKGTTIIEHPDGLLSDYLNSLDLLETFGDAQILPGHGPARASIAQITSEYRNRRLDRLSQLEVTIAQRTNDSIEELAEHIYPTKIHPSTRRAAERTILAQLRFLGDPRGQKYCTIV